MQNVKDILTKFEKIVSIEVCNKLAKKTGFVQRSTTRIQGHEFVQAMVIPNAFLESETLNSLSIRMQKINKSCDISASALAQRINKKTGVDFIKSCYEIVLCQIVKEDFIHLSDLPNLYKFNRVLIEDSTKAELHEKLSPHFEGSGGSASTSSLKINYVFDYLSEKIQDIQFFSGNVADQKLASLTISILKKDDLIIRDLGYYCIDRIKEIEQKSAYYITRLPSSVNVYETQSSQKPLDLARFLRKKMAQGIVDVQVFIGKEKVPVRLVACQIPEQAANKRCRNANKLSRKRGWQLSKKKKDCWILAFS